MIRALLAGRDLQLIQSYREHLEQMGLWVFVSGTEEQTVRDMLEVRPDLAVIEQCLSGMDALEVCRRVRGKYQGRIVLLAPSSDETDQIAALRTGADDYLVKPVSPHLLWARICALGRRGNNGSSGITRGERIEAGSMVLNTSTATASFQGEELKLTQGEFELLHILVRNVGQAVDRDTLYRELRGVEWNGLDRSLDQRIKRLRQKLGDDGRSPQLIKSSRGYGYKLIVPEVALKTPPK